MYRPTKQDLVEWEWTRIGSVGLCIRGDIKNSTCVVIDSSLKLATSGN